MTANPYPHPELAELLFACDRIADAKRLGADRKRALWAEVCGSDCDPTTVDLGRVRALHARLVQEETVTDLAHLGRVKDATNAALEGAATLVEAHATTCVDPGRGCFYAIAREIRQRQR